MKVMFASVPAVGHLFPLIPLSWALRAKGHEILFASYDGAECVAEAGLPMANIAPGLRIYDELFGETCAGRPDLVRRIRSTKGGDREAVGILLSRVGTLVVDAMLATARDFQPDLLVYEYASPAGHLVAAALDIPAVHYCVGFSRTTTFLAP